MSGTVPADYSASEDTNVKIFTKTLYPDYTVDESDDYVDPENRLPRWRFIEEWIDLCEQMGDLFVNGVSVGRGTLQVTSDVFRIQRSPGASVETCSEEDYLSTGEYYSTE